MVLSASVHKGCIVFGLELCAPRPATGDNETATTTHSNSNMDINELLEYARRVLPHLLTDLGLDGQCTGGDEGLDAIGEKLSVTATGHRLSIHVGPYSVYATYDKQSHDWLLEPGVVSMAGVPPGFMPELCLAQPRPALAPAAAPAAGVHAVQFSVQLMCAGAPFVPPQPHLVVTGVDPTDDSAFAECTGPLTASHNRHHNHAPSTVRAMQVCELLLTTHAYLATHHACILCCHACGLHHASGVLFVRKPCLHEFSLQCKTSTTWARHGAMHGPCMC